jgi:hypothetical protein
MVAGRIANWVVTRGEQVQRDHRASLDGGGQRSDNEGFHH